MAVCVMHPGFVAREPPNCIPFFFGLARAVNQFQIFEKELKMKRLILGRNGGFTTKISEPVGTCRKFSQADSINHYGGFTIKILRLEILRSADASAEYK